jgi:hypothetical protein
LAQTRLRSQLALLSADQAARWRTENGIRLHLTPEPSINDINDEESRPTTPELEEGEGEGGTPSPTNLREFLAEDANFDEPVDEEGYVYYGPENQDEGGGVGSSGDFSERGRRLRTIERLGRIRREDWVWRR